MNKNKIRVLVVEDSLFFQVLLRRILESDSYIEVVGIAPDGVTAQRMAAELRPDIITLDLHLPDISGLDLLKSLKASTAAPILVVSSLPQACEEALQAGATDFIEKVQTSAENAAEQFSLLLKLKIKMLISQQSAHSLFRRSLRKKQEKRDAPAPLSCAAAHIKVLWSAQNETSTEPDQTAVKHLMSEQNQLLAPPKAMRPQRETAYSPKVRVCRPQSPSLPSNRDSTHLIAIGASLGGTESTLEILRGLPPNMPPIIIAQHMPAGFTSAYALRLNQNCALTVREARNGELLLPGTALVAKGGEQTKIYKAEDGYHVRCLPDEGAGFHPSVDLLFESVAIAAGAHAVGVILTGMGRDGTAGLTQMHEAGAYTLGQDEKSCAVFGMPAAAWDAGAVDVLLPPADICDALILKSKV